MRRPPAATLFPYTTLFRSHYRPPPRRGRKMVFREREDGYAVLPQAGCRSEERFSRNAETDLVCRLLLEKKKKYEIPNHSRGEHEFSPTTRRGDSQQDTHKDVA